MSKPSPRKNLGRGLSTLLADVDLNADTPSGTRGEGRARAADTTLPIEKIAPNPDQPRRNFKPEDLDELVASIREKGVLQPLIVRPDPNVSGRYQIVAGERRWRAAQRAQLHSLPVIIRDFSDSEVLEVAIIENIQRTDLNPAEEAAGYRQLMDSFGHTQEQLAIVLGKSRSHIANLLRLLNLPDSVLEHLRAGRLSAGHARTLVTAENPETLAKLIIQKGLNVRQAEALARQGQAPKEKRALKPAKDSDTRAIEADLMAHLRLKVDIRHRPGGESGEITISYKSLDELDGLCQLLSR
ncbi:MAG: ParB/RepB/Spo0J family partition protein [Paracoccaceae bacterium]